ncbi:phosphate acetyltransferase [Bacillus norwichensis]|uniref:Phosphate acetyltransferase n=1 Tax=Bacillus norwichensis TaxID=2762217 RepID=A0ABR8VI20_9BACI|nr:phosphate acetyltransferase [Bacillus norwichensis]MBD8004412.1 phosphate acetyltransferase [Bacillus norwichensis]
MKVDPVEDLFNELRTKVSGWDRKIVFPEATDSRILSAAGRLANDDVLTPVLVGNMDEIQDRARAMEISLEKMEIYDPNIYVGMDEMIQAFIEQREGKVTVGEAAEILLEPNYFGTMLVFLDKANGLVSGAAHSTADTVRPALQIIKMKEGVGKTSGAFLMAKGEDKFVFADCAINIAPDSQDLAEIAIESAKTARMFDIEPRVAMLSFSTKGSAVSEETERVSDSVQIAREIDPDLVLDGELQFDAAFVPAVAQKKAPESDLQGNANIFVFPSLEAGNIGYKIAQRLGGYEAVGPILQGLNAPVNDLSRGCSEEDVYRLALITAMQSI